MDAQTIISVIPLILLCISIIVLVVLQIISKKKNQQESETAVEIINDIINRISPYVLNLFNDYIIFNQENGESTIKYDNLKNYIMSTIKTLIEGIPEDVLSTKYKNIILNNDQFIKGLIVEPLLSTLWNNYVETKTLSSYVEAESLSEVKVKEIEIASTTINTQEN